MHGDRSERGQRHVLVKPRHGALESRPAQHARCHRQAHQHRERDEDDRHHPGGAADQPPHVAQRVVTHEAAASRAREARRIGTGPTSSTSPLSCTITPPCSASAIRAASAPPSSASLESVSASSAELPSAVTPTSPVQAGCPVLGSSRWWAYVPSARRQIRTFSPDVATPPPSFLFFPIVSPVYGCSTSISYGSSWEPMPPTAMSPPQSTRNRA